ncbi:EscV/YscV/HrcV family type III secretion system export apparatus protein [Pandoraea faecigallinarum]|uniref:Type III secretion system protein InvA n=1 Tax=Pandoraea faecigallinarum TaxID=656179 RepID=A0A0H3WSW3_9BURK|nr:EscV/YscV/HrcV family type III secretion system export apparatus protein [Pandoraea faecigallinarum]AKM30715.1 EscV/YscV/HrcV family type III secretion system export apparatus protein [Pandoraea faecigallinarum]
MPVALLNDLRGRPEIVILILMSCVIAMLVIPLPTYLVDFLIGINIAISVLLFLGAFHIERILNFSSFPSMLLITTLFRLALSISTTRLILIDADAGKIIDSFGQFVIGDSLAVGFVVFAIVTIVQFIVIAKGSERVAEVAARFSLDGMPGKQMSIDADVKAGTLDNDGARERRSVLERESQLYGSFDGAMKFVKGDAIAGIVIIFVNLIGGIIVGMTQRGMELGGALTTYTTLTIGDGLVAQIPALLISVAAGFVVTRVNGEADNMGRTIISQLMGNRFVLGATALLTLIIGTLPGFPFVTFALLSCLLALACYFARPTPSAQGRTGKAGAAADAAGKASKSAGGAQAASSLASIDDLDNVAPATAPLAVVIPSPQVPAFEAATFAQRVRSQFFTDFGVHLPELLLRGSPTIHESRAAVYINEVRADEFVIFYDRVRVDAYTAEIAALGFEPVFSGPERGRCAWVTPDQGETLAAMHHLTHPPADELYQSLAVLLTRHVNEFFGIQETKKLLDLVEQHYPDLVKEVLRHVALQRVAEILQRLVMERISVRNMKLVMEVLAMWAPREKDVLNLVEHVRGALGRYICNKFLRNGELRVVMLSAEIEESVRRSIRQTAGGAFVNMDPKDAESLLDRVALALDGSGRPHKDIVLLASVDVRRFVKKLAETRFRDLEVLSFGELVDGVSVNVISTI